MDKILVSVFVPEIDDMYDIFIPINLEMKDVLTYVQEAIVDLSNKTYIINPEARLFDRNTGLIINTNNIVKFSGLKNGSLVMLMSVKPA